MSATQEYGRAFSLWRSSCHADWEAYCGHQFVTSLGDGTLPRRAFLHYLVQDYIFLKHFSRAWGLAIAKADSLAEMSACATTVNLLLNQEMQLHEGICAAEGITEQLAIAEEAPANLAYTRFVLDAGYSGDFTDLLAALAPCVLGYGEIGARLARTATSGTYADWIATYAGSDYQEGCHEVGALIDNALTSRFGERFETLPIWQQLSGRFTTATRLEVGFWDMGLAGA
ncbi:thiaminase II [Falsihalocynthiibacter sp. SS001]|uniref:thiaminase II n=1 Tax=Falsihalocynthiibacter sp. SS001 TaxID=3349698 RepID=UPI0036D3F9A9